MINADPERLARFWYIDGDGAADRIYVWDMAGQLVAFRIFNGSSAANLVAGA